MKLLPFVSIRSARCRSLLLYWILWYFFHVVNILLVSFSPQLCNFAILMRRCSFSHLATVRFFNCSQYGHVVEQQQLFFFPAFDCWFGAVFVRFFCRLLFRAKPNGLKAIARAMQSRGQFFKSPRSLLRSAAMREKKRWKWLIENAPIVFCHRRESSN